MSKAAAEVLDALADLQPNMLKLLGDLVRIPSISGTAEENDAQAFVAGVLDRAAFDVDHWRIDLDALADDPEFPGMEVKKGLLVYIHAQMQICLRIDRKFFLF